MMDALSVAVGVLAGYLLRALFERAVFHLKKEKEERWRFARPVWLRKR
jgi:hypothetical protein